MGSTLKRARRAKDKSKKNRLEKTERKFLQSRRGFYSPSPEALLFFETLPCPFECKEKCIERLRYYMEHNQRPRPNCEDVVLVGA